jgi:hypothetical protein
MNTLTTDSAEAIAPKTLEDALYQIENLSRVVALALESRLDQSKGIDRDMTAITCVVRNVNILSGQAITLFNSKDGEA